MGVIYKLTDDVAGFILEQKQVNPKLSCRKLARIVYETFQVKISKSAINNILKEAALSNPVGRPKGFHPDIAPDSASVVSKEESTGPPTRKLSPQPDPPHRKDPEKTVRPIKPVEKKVKPALTERFRLPDIPLPLSAASESGPAQKSVQKVPQSKKTAVPEISASRDDHWGAAVPASRGVLQDGMGTIILKAAEWALSDKPIFGDLLRRHLKGGGLMDLDAAGELILMLQPFGIQRVEDLALYNRQGLWALCGMKTRIDPASLQSVIKAVGDLQGLTVSMDVEMPQLFTDISFIKVTLEDASELWIDAQQTSVWRQGVPLPFFTSLPKILTGMARHLLNNSNPAILCNIPGKKEIPAEWIDFILAFENASGKRMTRMAVCNDRLEEITQFETIPVKKRTWIAGLWPWQEESFDRLKTLEKRMLGDGYKYIEINRLEKKYYLSEVKFHLSEKDLGYPQVIHFRAILARSEAKKDPFMAVITNIDSAERSTQDIWADYCERWPNLENSFNLFTSEHFQPLKEEFQRKLRMNYREFLNIANRGFLTHYITGTCGFMALVQRVGELLNQKCQKLFFPEGYGQFDVNEMKSRFYNISGYLRKESGRIVVQLPVDKSNYIYYKDLEYCVTRINEADLYDFAGRKLYINLLNNK